jgi:hypothetical protein
MRLIGSLMGLPSELGRGKGKRGHSVQVVALLMKLKRLFAASYPL